MKIWNFFNFSLLSILCYYFLFYDNTRPTNDLPIHLPCDMILFVSLLIYINPFKVL